MLYEIWYVTITIALVTAYFTFLRKVINLKMARNQSRNIYVQLQIEGGTG